MNEEFLLRELFTNDLAASGGRQYDEVLIAANQRDNDIDNHDYGNVDERNGSSEIPYKLNTEWLV